MGREHRRTLGNIRGAAPQGRDSFVAGRKIAAAAEDHSGKRSTGRAGKARSPGNCAGTSFARLLRDQGCSAESRALLQPVYDRFTEGFDTTDLKAAKALLDALAVPKALRIQSS